MTSTVPPRLKFVAAAVRLSLGVLVLAAAAAVAYWLTVTRPAAPHTAERLAPPVVPVMAAEQVALPLVFRGFGTARALDAAVVAAEVAGRVTERPETIEPGERVEAGDLLVALDPTDYEARVESLTRQIEATRAELSRLEVEEASLVERVTLTEEQVEASRRDLARAREVLDRGVGNQSEVDARVQQLQRDLVTLESLREQLAAVPARRAGLEATLTAQRADLRQAEADVERTRIRSPLAGRLQRVDVERGEFLRVGDPVARVVGLARVEIPVRLPVSASGFVDAGDVAELRPDGPGGNVWIATVHRVAPEADAATRTLTVFVVVEQEPAADPASLLRPGRFVAAEVTTSRTEPRLVVPRRVVDIDSVLVAEAPDPGWLESLTAEDNPKLGRLDLALARRLRRVARADVNVDRYIEATFPGLDPREDQWAVLAPAGVVPERALRPGDLVLTGNTNERRLDELVDARLPGETREPGSIMPASAEHAADAPEDTRAAAEEPS